MVFRGKLSGACYPCRLRRIKCDQRPEGCGSCMRRNITCAGYRDTQAARFVHETAPVIKKHAKRQSSSQRSHSVELIAVPTQHLAPSLDDVALSLFHGQYECLPGLITESCINDSSSPLPTCIKALSLATYGKTAKVSDMSIEAKKYYLAALQQTNKALASSKHSHNDTTLLSVMLLTGFESLTSTGKQSFEAWSAHIRGTAALLSVRGTQQLRTSDGRLLFMQASMNLVSHCLRSSHRIPAEIHSLTLEATKWAQVGSPEKAVWAVHQARLYLADLYSDTASRALNDPQIAIDRALAFDVELESIFAVGSPKISTEGVFTLESWSAAQAWTSMIICRTILHLLLIKLSRDFLSGEPDQINFQIAASRQTLQTLQSALLKNKPYDIKTAKEDSLLFRSDSKFHRLLSPAAGLSSASTAIADQLLISSLCGSKLLKSTKPKAETGQEDISWVLLLVGYQSTPSLYSLTAAPQLLRYMGVSLDLQEALNFVEALENGGS